ncbi:MAG: PadR family transcriptional regulator [Candidatus Bathyarchaeia archaeon]
MALKRLAKKVTVENLWLYVLRMVIDRPMYAYEIRKTLKERFGFSVATITVYFVLYRMAAEGLIRKTLRPPTPGRADRKYYEATERGKETLAKGIEMLERAVRKLA